MCYMFNKNIHIHHKKYHLAARIDFFPVVLSYKFHTQRATHALSLLKVCTEYFCL